MRNVFWIFWILLLFVGISWNFAEKKVLILGFDGVDPQLCQQWIAEGKLPHLQALQEQGSFQVLGTSNPAQSPVSWCCFATGTNPGKTNIFDFLARDPQNYHPRLGFAEEGRLRLLPDPLTKRYLVLILVGLCPLLLTFIAWLFYKKPQKSPEGTPVSFRRSTLPKIVMLLGVLLSGVLEVFLLRHIEDIPPEIPTASSLRKGEAFWKIATEQGVKTYALKVPISFPTDPLNSNGKLLSGLGVPDLLKTNGLWTLYYSPLHTNPNRAKEIKRQDTETSGRLVPLQLQGLPGDDSHLTIYGPLNILVEDQIKRLQKTIYATTNWKEKEVLTARREILKEHLDTTAKVAVQRRGNTVFIEGKEVPEKKWSSFYNIQFQMGSLITLHGLIRFYNSGIVHRPLYSLDPWSGQKRVVGIESAFEIYATPIQFDPDQLPGLPGLKINISSPRSYAGLLKEEIGEYYDTIGWAACTNALKDEYVSEEAFLTDLRQIFERQKKLTMNELAKKDWRIFFSLFESTDRVSHMMWRYTDKESPLYDETLAQQYGNSILEFYQKMDQVVGEVYKTYVQNNPETLFMVISDHGFQPFHRSVNLNTWLQEEGYLTLKNAPSSGLSSSLTIKHLYDKTLLANVDWSKTKAYSIGLGKIYLNVKGREPEGIVTESELEALKTEMITKLKKLRDPKRGDKPVVLEVYKREDIYKGPYMEESADLIMGFHRGYRISWQSTLGGFGDHVLEDNLMKWSGDHCSVDPSLTNGIFYSNKVLQLEQETPHIEHLAPTLLHYLGLPVPVHMDRKPLKFK
jgi:predicted AlkP superfamily phosphohydrolase/phosphomutase